MSTAYDLLLKKKSTFDRLYFGCPIIDSILGGLPALGITEVSGEAGSGKTQFCLQAALRAQIPSSYGPALGSVAYLSCGEGEFPIKRLHQMAIALEGSGGMSSTELLANVHIEQCYSSDDIQDSLVNRIPNLVRNKNIRVVIVDSLAGVLRSEFSTQIKEEMFARTAVLFKLAQHFKWLADIHNIVIIIVNQISEKGGVEAFGEERSSPALGLAWAHCINTRVRLFRDTSAIRATAAFVGTTQESKNETNLSVTKYSGRTMSLEISPLRPPKMCSFIISEEGLAGIPSG